MRLIDGEELYNGPWHTDENGYQWIAVEDVVNAPTIDPVKHGKWELVDGTEPRRYGCSECKRLSYTQYNYCSYCGTKMDGEE